MPPTLTNREKVSQESDHYVQSFRMEKSHGTELQSRNNISKRWGMKEYGIFDEL